MMRELKPFLQYKKAGFPWLKEIPSHWDMVPNRSLLKRKKNLVGDKHSDFRLLSLTKAGVIVRDVESGKGKFSVHPQKMCIGVA